MDYGNLALEMGDNGGSRMHRNGHVDDAPDTGGLCGFYRRQALLRLIWTEGRNKKHPVHVLEGPHKGLWRFHVANYALHSVLRVAQFFLRSGHNLHLLPARQKCAESLTADHSGP